MDKPLPEKSRRFAMDLLTTAFEGGSNYWYFIEEKILPEGTTSKDFSEGGRMQPFKNDYYHWSSIIPTTPGGALMIKDVSGEEFEDGENLYRLDLKAVRKAMKLFREKLPRKYFEIMNDGDFDANEGDAFLQLAIFGDIIYG